MALDEKYLLEIADRVMIQDLLARYAFAIDYATRNPEEWAALFVPGGRFEIPEISLVVEGHAALEEFAASLHRTVPGLHHVMSNFVIDLNGDRALGKCELNEFMLRDEAIYSNLHGWYEDDYVRVDGRWRFEVRRVHLPPAAISVASHGRIGEYFKGYFEMAQKYIRR